MCESVCVCVCESVRVCESVSVCALQTVRQKENCKLQGLHVCTCVSAATKHTQPTILPCTTHTPTHMWKCQLFVQISTIQNFISDFCCCAFLLRSGSETEISSNPRHVCRFSASPPYCANLKASKRSAGVSVCSPLWRAGKPLSA